MTLKIEQKNLLIQYRDKCYLMSLLCSRSHSNYSFIKQIINIPIILSNSVLAVINGSSIDDDKLKVINVITNAFSALMIMLINNFAITEKITCFKETSVKFTKLTHEIEDIIINDLEEINIDKVRDVINKYDNICETCSYDFPNHIKNEIKKNAGGRTLPNILNCTCDIVIQTA